TVHWDILPGYYLYKSKFKFVSHVTGIKLGEAQLPAGEIKEDPYFGKQEIYHKGVSVKLPYQGVGKLDLELIYQGCFEKGFCYPPQHRHVNVELVAASLPTAPPPAPATKTATPAASSAVHPQDLAALVGGAGTGDEGNFLKPDEAFIFSAVAKDQNTLELRWKVAPGYYLYRQKFHLASDNPDVQLGTPDFPQGQIKNDPYMGTSEIYTQDVDALIPVTRSNGAGKFNLQASYQGCAEAGFCYPPIAKTEPIDLAVAPPMAGAAPAAAPPIAEQDRLAVLLQTGSLLIVMLTFLGVGMLLTFTPCVLPMIPIISGIIVGQGKKLTTAHAFALSLTYVLAMAVVYAVVGVVVGLLGSNIQLALQNPWVLGAFSAIFVALALSMFGLYDLQMPSAVQSWLTQHSNSQKSGVFVGAGIMGALSALICGPCITAPLVAALVFIGETHSALRGGLALFALGLGMGVPLLIIGTTEGRLLPKPGPWMNTVKAVFGVIMLGLAIWFLSRVIPGPLTLALCAALSLVCGIYLGALEPLHVHAPHTGWRTLWKGLGILAVLYGLIMLVGAAMGGDDPLKPLAPLARAATAATLPGQPAPANGLNFKRIKTTADLNAALAAASAAGKPAMLDFAADWCISCKELEHDTYTVAAVQAALSNVVLLQADWTAYDDADKALGQDLGVAGPPTVLFYGSDGKEIKNLRVVGLVNTDEFMSRLKAAYSNK
ncbi:MAG: protein-disulfide reductase DsbD, partial [Bacillota bacterium]